MVPTDHRRLNEFVGLLLLTIAILCGLSLVSFSPDDPSFNISRNPQFETRPANFVGVVGAYSAEVSFQLFGYPAFLIPIFLGIYAFYWLASRPVESFGIRLSGMILMVLTLAAAFSVAPSVPLVRGHLPAGGVLGTLLSGTLEASLNPAGTAIVLVSTFLVSLFLATTFSFARAIAILKSRFGSVSALWQRWASLTEKGREQTGVAAEETRKEKPIRKQTIVTEKPELRSGRGSLDSKAVETGEGLSHAPIRPLKIPKPLLPNPEFPSPDRKSTRLNSSHIPLSRMPSSA